MCGQIITRARPTIRSTMTGGGAANLSCRVTSFGAADFSQTQAGPNGGDGK
jgi:hypothetical protein